MQPAHELKLGHGTNHAADATVEAAATARAFGPARVMALDSSNEVCGCKKAPAKFGDDWKEDWRLGREATRQEMRDVAQRSASLEAEHRARKQDAQRRYAHREAHAKRSKHTQCARACSLVTFIEQEIVT